MIQKDLQLLKDLCSIERHYREEYKVVSYILNYCHKWLSDFNLNFEVDEEGNLFIIKNTNNPKTYPLVIAHMDCVQNFLAPRRFLESEIILSAQYVTTKKEAGLSADDSCGIWVALKLLKEIPNLKVLFTVQEETGGVGAYAACENEKFFSNVAYMLQADRRGSSDLITHTNGIDVTSKEFEKAIKHLSKKFNYRSARGTFTDVGILSEYTCISGCNISCGYRNEHTEKEYINLVDLERCYNYIKSIIKHLANTNKVYKIQVQHSYFQRFRNEPYYDDYFSKEPDYNSFPCDTCKHWDCMNCDEWKNI